MSLCVLHLVGSPTSEFYAELSRLYAADCLVATRDPDRYEFHIAHVGPNGRWCFPGDLAPDTIDAAESVDVAAAIAHITALRVDVVVPQMFCVRGMTAYRALFDVLEIPYVGNAADAMALTATKDRARAVVASHDVAVPAAELLGRDDQPTLTPPYVVKPVDADNSIGVSLVRGGADFDAAMRDALAHTDRALVETFVPAGREVRCGIIERDGELRCLPLEEYRLDAVNPIRRESDKLARSEDGSLVLVAKNDPAAWIVAPDDPIVPAVHEAARRCHVALGCRDYSLIDFRIDPDGRPWFLEAGLYNSFAPTSVISTMARAAGISLDDVFHDLIGQGNAPPAVSAPCVPASTRSGASDPPSGSGTPFSGPRYLTICPDGQTEARALPDSRLGPRFTEPAADPGCDVRATALMSMLDGLMSAVGTHRGAAAADRLCAACVDLLSVDAAAISLVFDGTNTGTLGASSDRARLYDELQFTVGEGPCLESVLVRAPVLVIDLAAEVDTGRWPAYGPALLAYGVCGVFAMPVVVAGEYVGALELFRTRTGVLDASDLSGALAAAELAEMPMLDLLAQNLQAASFEPDASAWTELNTVTRAEVSQATGMLVAQLEIEPAEALIRLRAHAYATGRAATEVARDILERRLRLDVD